MVKDSTKDNKCPKYDFAGINSGTKFSAETNNRFPKGFAVEKRPRIITVKKSGQEIQEFAKNKNNEIIFNEITRCPVCGFEEQ